MRILIGFLACLIGMLTIALTVMYWPHTATFNSAELQPSHRQQADLEQAKALLADDKPQEVLAIAKRYKNSMEAKTPQGQQWLSLLVRACEQLNDSAQLMLIYEHTPQVFKGKERASLLVADEYIKTGQVDRYSQLRQQWSGHEQLTEAWLLLDADKLLFDGKRAAAIELLATNHFEGAHDSARLVRLGLLNVMVEPEEAWHYFSQAVEKDPHNAELRTYRAKLLEAADKPTLATQEYVKAMQLEPKDLWLRDQVAAFYLRQRQFPQALQLWADSLSAPSTDTLWLKALFWNKVLLPITFEWQQHVPPQGTLNPLLKYLLTLKPRQYWDPEKFAQIPQNLDYLHTQQATYWLRLIAALKQGQEREAMQLIEYNPFHTESWNPELELALLRTLRYRQKGTLQLGGLEENMQTTASHRPPFFQELELQASQDQPLSPAIQALLTSKDAFSALFLATGWLQVALDLQTLAVIPEEFPAWYVHNITHAMRLAAGDAAALAFLSQQKPTAAIELFKAELLIATHKQAAALEILAKLATADSAVGYRAAYLQSVMHLENRHYEQARQVINQQPRLREDVAGQELLARLALLEGKEAVAEKIYTAIAHQSEQARSFLARKAFSQHNWVQARALTEQLLQDHPEDVTLQENMRKIAFEEAKGKSFNAS